jgi:hypothetical protein
MSYTDKAVFRRSTLGLIVAICFSVATPAAARSRFDGIWNLTFVTRRGPCDPAYNFTVDVVNGYVSHPNILTFRGRVTPSGAVRASVRVGDKYAWGSGRLSEFSGRGVWSGRAGPSRCSGDWVARRD